jgi:hypothetical protein
MNKHTQADASLARSYTDLTKSCACADAPRATIDVQNLGRSIFQQSWWLDCVTQGQCDEVTVKNGGRTVGWLPYVVKRRWGFAVSDMPLLTHTLGPIIHAGVGRPNTQLLNRFTITTELLRQLPKLAYFRQVLAPGNSEALAYQSYGCHVKCQFTFIADCCDIDAEWVSMRDKTRNLIRRSREKNIVSADADPEEFLRFYDANCRARGQINRYQTPTTKQLLGLCVARDQGKIILLRDQKYGAINAGVFVVWDDSHMYFLMSTRATGTADSGAVSLLVWSAMNEAHRRGVSFDFDGVSSMSTFRFLSGFGGAVASRFAVEKFAWAYHSLDKLRALTYGNLQRPFE